MKYFLYLLALVMCCINCVAQTYIEPVFDRADYPEYLHINKIEISKDTTFIHCTLTMPPSSWGTISGETYLYNYETQEKYPLLKCDGLPISPQKRDFTFGGVFQISFYFPYIPKISKLDFIENPNKKAFNIYGVDVTKESDNYHSIADVEDFYKIVSISEFDNDTIKKKKILDYIETLNDDHEKWQLLSNLSNHFLQKQNFAMAIMYRTKAVEIEKRIRGHDHPKYATSLHELSRFYYSLGDYGEAIRLCTEALGVWKRNLETGPSDYVTALSDLAEYYTRIGNYSEAIQLGKEALDIWKMFLGTDNRDYAITLSNLTTYYAYLGNYDEAIRLETEALEIKKRNLGTEHSDYAMSLSNIAGYYSALGNYSEAIRLGTKALEIRKQILGIEHPDYATSLSNLAVDYSALGNYSEAIRLGTKALEIRKQILGVEHPDYARSLDNLANYYARLSNYAEAIRLGTEALYIRKKVLGGNHPDYAMSLSNLAGYYSDLGNYEEAIRLGTEALGIRKNVLGMEHPSYASSMSSLALYYAYLGNYGKAIRFGTEALETTKKVLGAEHPDFARSLGNLAMYYAYLGDNVEAIRLGTQALELIKKHFGTEHSEYAGALGNLASYNSSLGNYTDAIRFGTEALETTKKVLGAEHPAYARLLGNLAVDYYDLGDYVEAIRLETEALEIRKKVFGTEHPDYATSLGNLAGYYSALGNNEDAIRLEIEAMKIREKVWGTEHPLYAASLGSLAFYHSRLGNNEDAIRLGTEALEIRKKIFGTEHPDYATSLGNLAGYYSALGNNEDAIRLEIEAMRIREMVWGTGHRHYLTSLGNIASYNLALENSHEAYLYYKKCIDGFQTYVLRNFVEQSSHLKEIFWGQHECIYTKVLPTYVNKYKTAASISELYDKTCLFAKGLLLNSDIELRKLILESGDSILIDKYNTLSTNVNIYNKLIEKPIHERFMNADSLNNVIQQQEMELARESKVYGDYTRNLTSTWKDVQNHLGTDDIAIEFIDFPILGTDSTMYAALTLKKDYDSPHMMTLFEKKQLMAIPESAYYTQTSIYDLIWEPLEEELENVHNIYFSPSGELHRIGIEYLPINQTENISDKYSLHRLSSTRQLALIQDGIKGEKSILYGGINYDENTNVASNASTSSVGGVKGINVIYRSNVDSLLLRSSYEYLEGTKREVDQIADQMKQHQIHYLYYSGADGSEESFKKLDGTKPKMMHIATHGFYLTEEEAKLSNFARPHMELMMGDNQIAGHPIEDKPMTRSGLLFSGCNHAIQHEQIPDGVEDGILTAQEISTLDLRGLDLVVLSACQTALGDIASGEGVFGLQRGFKKAGAKTIIMSLWKVDDDATRILMVELYKNLMSGKSKRQSLKDAQKYLREYDNGKYDKPEYWASFIMLDGLK